MQNLRWILFCCFIHVSSYFGEFLSYPNKWKCSIIEKACEVGRGGNRELSESLWCYWLEEVVFMCVWSWSVLPKALSSGESSLSFFYYNLISTLYTMFKLLCSIIFLVRFNLLFKYLWLVILLRRWLLVLRISCRIFLHAILLGKKASFSSYIKTKLKYP